MFWAPRGPDTLLARTQKATHSSADPEPRCFTVKSTRPTFHLHSTKGASSAGCSKLTPAWHRDHSYSGGLRANRHKKRADERTRATDLISSRVIGLVLPGWRSLARLAFLKEFLYSAFPCVAPYCVPGGVRVVSTAPRIDPTASTASRALIIPGNPRPWSNARRRDALESLRPVAPKRQAATSRGRDWRRCGTT